MVTPFMYYGEYPKDMTDQLYWSLHTDRTPNDGIKHFYIELNRKTMVKKKTKYVHAGRYVVEVEVELIESEGGWAPYLSV